MQPRAYFSPGPESFSCSYVIHLSIEDTPAGEGSQRVAGCPHQVLPDRRRGLCPHLRHLSREGISGGS